MIKSNYHVLGVMSGTSLDGIDIAQCFLKISSEKTWSYKIDNAITVPYPKKWDFILKEAVHFSKGRLMDLNEKYTFFLSEVLNSYIKDHNIERLDAVCSHGHTIQHQPDKGYTLQIGNLPELAKFIGETVVCDFRVQDVEFGGQGAPLVPIGDRLLFPEYDYCLNLGGFANVSSEENGQRIAYDICPVNIVLNKYASELGKAYDNNGEIARSGEVDKFLLDLLNGLEYYKQPFPKSLGMEWVNDQVIPLIQASKVSVEDKLSTITEHVAYQIATQFLKDSKVLITGGGTYNNYLLDRIGSFKSLEMSVPSKTIIEFKEALVFALLGVLKLRNEVNCLASVTGAERDHSSGNIF